MIWLDSHLGGRHSVLFGLIHIWVGHIQWDYV